ncbi:hypothetical protein AGR3A_Lc130059 [Agrobacterium tomkonis CFBP 6623]|uniref:Uncharacterized protein n=1 Tax=Agrobacterium tomkonis CFBP 6623 TaxID=1183432 RepID=A0A1S7R5T9_9HYPH|nr:hypothetical protein AGR3A_Lc130059 [Agrobacterium tomkonis CFBP 6623]
MASITRPPISSTCISMPKKPAMPPKPPPINMPNRPPINRPPIRPPIMPPNRPRLCCGAACAPGRAGWAALGAAWLVLGVMLRLIGAVWPGAVLVEGGAEYVRVPRLPKPPPARRASAISTATKDTAIPSAATANKPLKRRKAANITISCWPPSHERHVSRRYSNS